MRTVRTSSATTLWFLPSRCSEWSSSRQCRIWHDSSARSLVADLPYPGFPRFESESGPAVSSSFRLHGVGFILRLMIPRLIPRLHRTRRVRYVIVTSDIPKVHMHASFPTLSSIRSDADSYARNTKFYAEFYTLLRRIPYASTQSQMRECHLTHCFEKLS